MKHLWLGALVLAAPALAQDADGGEPPPMEIEAFENPPAEADAGVGELVAAPAPSPTIESFETPTAGPTARLYGFVDGAGMVDTRFDSPPKVDNAENVGELRARALLGVDVKVSDWLRVVLEGRAQVRAVTQRDFERTKGFFEPMLGDAYVDLYSRHVDLRVGNQRVALGANQGLAPADMLNPRDLRLSFATTDPEDAMLPVFAVRARGELSFMSWMVAYAPFFTPNRYFVFGQDEGLLQPGADLQVANRRIDPSIEDYIQERILETERPPPMLGDLALRAVTNGSTRIGASYVWANEKLPQVRTDPELQALLRSQTLGQPVDPALLASVSSRVQAGENLYQGRYQRNHVFSLEGSRVIGPGQLDVDVSYSPQQTFFDASFAPLRKSAVTWVVSYSQASDSPLVYAISYLGMAVPGVGANEQLFLLEPATAVGADRAAFLHVFFGTVAYPVWHDRFELSLRAAFEPIQRSFAVAPKITFQGIDRLKLYLAAEFYEGNAYSPFGYQSRNDKVIFGARVDLF